MADVKQQCSDVEPAGCYILAESAVTVVVVVPTLLLRMLVCKLFNLTVSATMN